MRSVICIRSCAVTLPAYVTQCDQQKEPIYWNTCVKWILQVCHDREWFHDFHGCPTIDFFLTIFLDIFCSFLFIAVPPPHRTIGTTGLSGDRFHFNSNGDGPARYNIIHFKQTNPGRYRWIKVGEYYEGELRLNMNGKWNKCIYVLWLNGFSSTLAGWF